MHIICRHCRCGSMEALPGIHRCKSDCNLFIMDPTWTSFLINLTLPLQTRNLLPWGFYVALRYSFIFSFFGNPLLSSLSKLCYVNVPFLISSCAALLTSLILPVLQWSASTPMLFLLEGIHLLRRQRLLLDLILKTFTESSHNCTISFSAGEYWTQKLC